MTISCEGLLHCNKRRAYNTAIESRQVMAAIPPHAGPAENVPRERSFYRQKHVLFQ
jgi:hypothetical protein